MTDWRRLPALTLAVALAFFSAATPLPAAGPQNGPNIAQLKTYTWVTVGGSEHGDEITSAQVKQAIDAQLSTKGLTRTDGTSDLELEYWVEVQPERLSIGNGSNMGMGVGGGVRSAPTTSPATERFTCMSTTQRPSSLSGKPKQHGRSPGIPSRRSVKRTSTKSSPNC
jgi:hypothetical protein